MTDPIETSAGEADSFQRDLDRHMQDPEFRRSYEEQTRRLEAGAGAAAGTSQPDSWDDDKPITETQLNAVRISLRDTDAAFTQAAMRKVMAEVGRLRKQNRKLSTDYLDVATELAELRAADNENIGTETRPLTKRELRDIGMTVVGPLKYVPERWDHETVARLYWALMQQRGEAIMARRELAKLRERIGGDMWRVRYQLGPLTEWTEPTRHETSARDWLETFHEHYPDQPASLWHGYETQWREVPNA